MVYNVTNTGAIVKQQGTIVETPTKIVQYLPVRKLLINLNPTKRGVKTL